jgi:hypothetical protein
MKMTGRSDKSLPQSIRGTPTNTGYATCPALFRSIITKRESNKVGSFGEEETKTTYSCFTISIRCANFELFTAMQLRIPVF